MSFDSQTALRENEPAYFVRIDGIATKDYSTHPIQGFSVAKLVCMKIPRGETQSVDLLENTATIGSLEIPMLDVDGEITNLISTEKASPLVSTLINRKMTLYGGYFNETETNFRELFTGEIRDVRLEEPGLYIFEIADFKRRYEETLMKSLGTVRTLVMDNSPAAGQANVTFASVSGVANGQVYLLYKKTGAVSEKLTVQSVNTGTRVVTFTTNLLNAYAVGDIATNAPRIRGNVVNVFYSLLTGTFSTLASSAYPLIYSDFSPEGLTLTDADLDLASFLDTRDRFLGEYDVEFLFTGPTSAKSFFEKQIYPLGFYPTVNGKGQVGIRAFVPPGPQDPAPFNLDKEHCLEFPTWHRNIREHLNKVIVYGDRDLGSGATAFTTLATQEDTSDQSTTKEKRTHEISSDGLRTALGGVSIAEEIAYRVRRRFFSPPIEVRATAGFTKRGIEVGDIVALSHPNLPDNVAGTLGLTNKIMEVTKISYDFEAGHVVLTLVDTAFKKFAWLGGASMSDYGSATPDEKLYAYWGDTNNKVGGGTVDGYEIY